MKLQKWYNTTEGLIMERLRMWGRKIKMMTYPKCLCKYKNFQQ